MALEDSSMVDQSQNTDEELNDKQRAAETITQTASDTAHVVQKAKKYADNLSGKNSNTPDDENALGHSDAGVNGTTNPQNKGLINPAPDMQINKNGEKGISPGSQSPMNSSKSSSNPPLPGESKNDNRNHPDTDSNKSPDKDVSDDTKSVSSNDFPQKGITEPAFSDNSKRQRSDEPKNHVENSGKSENTGTKPAVSEGNKNNSSNRAYTGEPHGQSPVKGKSSRAKAPMPSVVSSVSSDSARAATEGSANAARQAGGKTAEKAGKTAGKIAATGAKAAVESVKAALKSVMAALLPYVLIILLVLFIVIFIVLIAYAIAYSYRDYGETQEATEGEYEYTWYNDENKFLSESEKKHNATIIYIRLKDEGFSTQAISGILGNWEHESSINPGMWQNQSTGSASLGYGLAQWTPSTKITNYLTNKGLEINDGDGQLDYFIENVSSDWSTPNSGMGFPAFKTSTDTPEKLSDIFQRSYEHGWYNANIRSYAKKWFNWLKENGDREAEKLSARVKKGSYNITIKQIEKCQSVEEYLTLVMPAYKAYCKQFGLKYPGVLALQYFHEVEGMSFPLHLSTVARADNNLGGLKYSPSIPGATSGVAYPSNEGNGTYCHFQSVGDYIYAQCWNASRSLYQSAINNQSSMERYTRAHCSMWVKGVASDGSSPAAYSESIISEYKRFGLAKYENK